MFFGEVKTQDGHSVAGGLTFSDGHLVLSSDDEPLGVWPVDEVVIDPIDSRTLRITIGDESVDFLSEDAGDPIHILEARRVGTSSMWVAAAPIVWERAETGVSSPRGAPRPAAGHRVAAFVAIIATAAIAFSGFSLMQSTADADPESSSAAQAAAGPAAPQQAPTTPTPSTVAIPDGVPEVIAPPGTPLVDVTDTWNRLSSDHQTFFHLDAGARSGRWDRVAVEFATTEFGMFSGASLLGDTSGTAQSDRMILVAIGQLIATVDPSLDEPARRSLLGRLGVDMGSPRVQEFGGSLATNGVEYILEYDAVTGVIHFEATLLG
jgi:hypothetical protein